MKDYLNQVNQLYPVRRSRREKEAFRNYILQESASFPCPAHVESQKRHHNLVIGDIASAKILFTAHYDTPAASVIPNLMLPKNKGLSKVLHFILPSILGVLSWFAGYNLAGLIAEKLFAHILLGITFYIGLFFVSFYLLTWCARNKHNKNDNTSGVAVVLSLACTYNANDVAFVLFDNEEKGLLGSKALKEAYGETLNDKLVINFDCVGVGNNILCIAKDGAKSHALYDKLAEHIISNAEFDVSFHSTADARANTDYKNFHCGVAVMACQKKRGIFYTGRIHTRKDTVANLENIDFLVNCMTAFIKERQETPS